MDKFEICPFDAPLGAEIRGLDIRKPLDRAPWRRFGRLGMNILCCLFRGQTMTGQQHSDITAQFGALDHPSDRLLAIAAGEGNYTWVHQWRRGDLVWWDNRCAMHRRDAFDPNARRIMHRTQLAGDRPF
jgi:alpha-ketoglutarate-dependent taurine dioxygenase